MLDRDLLLTRAVGFLGSRSPDHVEAVRARVGAVLAAADDAAIERLLARLATTGQQWGYQAPDDLARRINHAMADIVLADGSAIERTEHLAAADRGSVTFLPNHLSFADANLFECLLHRQGFDDVAKKLAVLAGPKVYSDFYRKLSSLCFGSVKTPQSPSRASGEALMPRREVARIARLTIRTVSERRSAGDHPLLFVEGTRSRDGTMQRALAAASRYLEGADTIVVPVGISGSDRLVPIGEERAHAARVTARLGAPVRPRDIFRRCGGNRTLVMDVVGLLVAAVLPERCRGFYAGDALDEARSIAAEITAAAASPR